MAAKRVIQALGAFSFPIEVFFFLLFLLFLAIMEINPHFPAFVAKLVTAVAGDMITALTLLDVKLALGALTVVEVGFEELTFSCLKELGGAWFGVVFEGLSVVLEFEVFVLEGGWKGSKERGLGL